MIRPLLIGILIGTVSTFIAACIALHGNNVRWQCEAYEHFAAVWTMDMNTGKTKWMWLNDYFRQEIAKARAGAVPPMAPARGRAKKQPDNPMVKL